jgi:glutaredoxin-like protein NrdH
MNTIIVEGKNKENQVLLYTLTTCKRCKKTKEYLVEHDIAFEFIDVDVISAEARNEIFDILVGMKIPVGFPVSIIDDTKIISGYHPDELKDALKL